MLDRTAKLKTYQTYIDGRWIDAASGKTFETCDPYTGQPWALIPECDKVDVDQAVDAASRAFERVLWPKMKPSARGKIMRRIAQLSNMPSTSVKWKYGTTESSFPKWWRKPNTCQNGFTTREASLTKSRGPWLRSIARITSTTFSGSR